VTTPSKLTVSWQMSQPPVAAKSWYPWGHFANSSDATLEAALSWPAGTVSALRHGFKAELSRSVGWESDSEAVLTAAGVFRRGVAARHPGEAEARRDVQGSYDIEIVQHQPDLSAADTFFIIDGHVAKYWPKLVIGPKQLILTLDEHTKSLSSVAQILASPDARNSEHWCVVGGGLLTDVAAFAASIASATVDFVPTTLLAMADACVGGKTGVNFSPYGKNQIGAFYFPSLVRVWPGWLASLPERELLGGAAECIKHAFLRGDMVLAESLADAVRQRDLNSLETLLAAVISLKVDVVTADPAENGMRAILNFGHTLAHALEAAAQANLDGDASLSHGEAVGVGMVFALIMSRKHAGLSELHCKQMLALLGSSGCVLSLNKLSQRLGVRDLRSQDFRRQIKSLVAHDKKNKSDQLTQWILLKSPGHVARTVGGEWTLSLSLNVVDELWEDFLKTLPDVIDESSP